MLIWTFGWTALAFNDAKRDLTVVEIVYRNSKMNACLLDLFRTGWKRITLKILGNCWMLLSAVEFCWCVMCDTSDAPFHFLHRSRSATFHLCGRSPEYNRLPSKHSLPSVAFHHIVWERTPGFGIAGNFAVQSISSSSRLSVHLPRSASSNFLAGEDVLLFPRALTWTDITHGLVQLSTCSHVLLNARQGLPAWISNSPGSYSNPSLVSSTSA